MASKTTTALAPVPAAELGERIDYSHLIGSPVAASPPGESLERLTQRLEAAESVIALLIENRFRVEDDVTNQILIRFAKSIRTERALTMPQELQLSFMIDQFAETAEG